MLHDQSRLGIVFKNVPITILRGIFDEVTESLPNIHNMRRCEQGLKFAEQPVQG